MPTHNKNQDTPITSTYSISTKHTQLLHLYESQNNRLQVQHLLKKLPQHHYILMKHTLAVKHLQRETQATTQITIYIHK